MVELLDSLCGLLVIFCIFFILMRRWYRAKDIATKLGGMSDQDSYEIEHIVARAAQKAFENKVN